MRFINLSFKEKILNSSKILIISKNSDIWLFLPSNNGCTFLLLKKKKHKLLSEKVVSVVGVAFLLVEGLDKREIMVRLDTIYFAELKTEN